MAGSKCGACYKQGTKRPRRAATAGFQDRSRSVCASSVSGGGSRGLGKPTGTIVFPIHTGAVVELYKRAWDELDESDSLTSLSVEERAWVERECWRVTGLVFRPGIAVRAALDAAAQSRSLLPAPLIAVPFDTLRAAQLSFLATWAVFTAA